MDGPDTGLGKIIFKRAGRRGKDQPELHLAFADLYLIDHVQGHKVLFQVRVHDVREGFEYIVFGYFFHDSSLFY